jgi:hypothetical protein
LGKTALEHGLGDPVLHHLDGTAGDQPAAGAAETV